MNKKVIILTEQEFYNVIKKCIFESVKPIITESQESKSISQAKRLVMDRLHYTEQQADEFVRVSLRNDIPVLRTPQGGKFILGVTRMYIDGDLRSANDISNLNATLKLVASDAHINEYDRNLNGIGAYDLIQRFSKAMTDNLEMDKKDINNMSFNGQSEYNIVRIDSFEQAQEYGRYTSWCVTHYEDMFDSYTSNGFNQFYFCLRNGFENEKPIAGENCPLDSYGLSMIAISVNENGMLNTCTCRWNHDNGGDDNIMNTKEISNVIRLPFYRVFKPNNKWKDTLSSVIERIKKGEDLNSVFDYVGLFSSGFAIVRLDRKFNFIDRNGNLVSNQWFDNVNNFNEGLATVELNGKFNLIDENGKLLSNQWFDYVGNFRIGFAGVCLNKKYNIIDRNGKLVSDQWFDNVGVFPEGFIKVWLNGKQGYLNPESGNVEWY